MKPSAIGIFSMVLFFAACQTKQEYFTKEQLQKKADSLTAVRFEELERQAAEDLDRRISIEVKPKVDSILEGIDIIVPQTVDAVLPNMPLSRDSFIKDTL